MYKLNMPRVHKHAKQSDNRVSAMILEGVEQFLGIKPGVRTVQVPGQGQVAMPSMEMIEFLVQMKVLEKQG